MIDQIRDKIIEIEKREYSSTLLGSGLLLLFTISFISTSEAAVLLSIPASCIVTLVRYRMDQSKLKSLKQELERLLEEYRKESWRQELKAYEFGWPGRYED